MPKSANRHARRSQLLETTAMSKPVLPIDDADNDMTGRKPPQPVAYPNDIELGTIDQACRMIGGEGSPIDPATYYRGVKAGRYPAPVKVSPNIARVPLG